MVIYFPTMFKRANWPFYHVLLSFRPGGGGILVFCKIPIFNGGVRLGLDAV